MAGSGQKLPKIRRGVCNHRMRDAVRVPLHTVMTTDGFRSSRVRAGEAGLDRVVMGLSIIESPDVLDWVRPHTLVVTGGFPLRHLDPDHGLTEEALCRFVSQLDDLNVAGLAVQLGSHLTRVPDAAVRVADELGFPLIELPTDVPFDQLFGQVAADVGDASRGVDPRGDQLHVTLENLVLEGADLQRIADQVAHVLDLGIIVTSIDGREMAAALPAAQRARLAAADLFDDTGRFRTERVRLPLRGLRQGEIVSEPVVAGGSDLARLIAVGDGIPIGAHVRVALQRAAIVVALLITQRQALTAVENKYRGDFLRDVLSGRARNREHSEQYALGLGWSLDVPCIVVCAQLDPPGARKQAAATRIQRSWQTRFHNAWTQVVGRESRAFPCADFSDEIVSLLALPDAASRDPGECLEQLQRLVERIVRDVAGDRGGGRRPFSVGTSRLVTSFEQLPTAYQQARRATEVGRRFSGGNTIAHFDSLGIHRLIGLIPDDAELVAFARDTLGMLAEDTPQAADLRDTLQVLLDHNLNVAEASRALLMHYNTMRYRITKLEKLLGPFTSDPGLRLNIAVALQVHRIRG